MSRILLPLAIAWSFTSCSVRAAILGINENAIGMPSFDEFVKDRARSYGSEEHEARRAIFDGRRAIMEAHNSQPGKRWVMGLNAHWDWTEDELDSLHGGTAPSLQENVGFALMESKSHSFNRVVSDAKRQEKVEALARINSMPKDLTWGFLNATKPDAIRDQKHCGSCWAVTSTALLDMHHEIYQKKARTFSPQQLVNCVPNPDECGGKGGCKGATVELGLDYALKQGLAQENQVPYEASTETCVPMPQAALLAGSLQEGDRATEQNLGRLQFGMTSFEKLPENKYEPLMQAVVEKGPVGVSVHARGWHFYGGGIFDDCAKDVVIGHAVTLTGYGQDEEEPGKLTKYWAIQNSWGPDWGEHGGIRLLRTDDEEEYCGVDTDPQKGVACKGGPPSVKVCGTCGILYDSAYPTFETLKGETAVKPHTKM